MDHETAQPRVKPTSLRSEGKRREKPSLVRAVERLGAKTFGVLLKSLGIQNKPPGILEMKSKKDHEAIHRFIQVSGFSFFLFGIAAILFRIVQFIILGDPPLEILVLRKEFLALQGLPSLVVAIFFLLGSTALYLRQAKQLGIIGLITYFVAFSLMVLSSGAMWTYAFTAPVLAREAPQLLTSPSSGIIQAVIASMALGQIGWLLLVLVSFKSRNIPRWSLWLSILSIVLVVVMTPFAQTQLLRFIYNILLGAGPLAIGYVLWRDLKGNNSNSNNFVT